MATVLSNLRLVTSFTTSLVNGPLNGSVTTERSESPAVGNAAGQLEFAVARNVTIATGVPLDIDLTAVADAAGNVVAFAKLCGWLLLNDSAVAGENLVIGGGANPIIAAAGPTARPLGASMETMTLNGIVVDATHKTFRVAAAAGAAVNGRLVLFGRS